MLHYYLKLAYRGLLKTKISSMINIIGLCFGFTCAFYIAVWVKNELGYDRFHDQAENLYLVGSKNKLDANFKEHSPFHSPHAERYKNFAEIEQACGITPLSGSSIKDNGKIFRADGIAASGSFFDLFHFPVLRGTSETFSDSAQVIFLTEKLAKKLFGNQDVVGKMVDFKFDRTEAPYVIGGILENPPSNSTIQFEFVVPWYSNTNKFWGVMGFDFVQLHPQADIASLNEKLLHADFGKMGYSADPGNPFQASVIPLTSIYLDSSFSRFKHGNTNYLWIVGLIGLAVLILTVVNHINLTSSQIALRNKELSIRKLIGSGNRDFLLQFIIESLLFIGASLTLTAVVVQLSATSFFEIVGQEVNLTALFSGDTPFVLAGVLVMITLVSAVVLASYFNHSKPMELLKGNSSGNVKLSAFKEKLMVFQIIIAITGIVITLGLNMQLRLMLDKDPGFEKENIVRVGLSPGSNFKTSEERKAAIDYVNNTLNSESYIMDFDRGNFPTETTLFPWQMESDKPAQEVAMLTCGKNFFTLFGIELMQGSIIDGSEKQGIEEVNGKIIRTGGKVVINESAVREFQLKDPIGHTIKNSSWGDFEVVGVVKDFSFESTGTSVRPLVIVCQPYDSRPVLVKIAPGRTKEALALLEQLHSEMKPGIEFTYTFFDQEFDLIYKRDIILSKMMNVAAVLSIAIAILGLFSLVLIFAKEKTKEIGIRKIMGAHVSEIINMIGYHFLKRMLIAFCIAVPLSYFALHQWLENFAYKIELSWWLFATGGLVVFGLAFLTISFHAYKSARANPIDSLRYE